MAHCASYYSVALRFFLRIISVTHKKVTAGVPVGGVSKPTTSFADATRHGGVCETKVPFRLATWACMHDRNGLSRTARNFFQRKERQRAIHTATATTSKPPTSRHRPKSCRHSRADQTFASAVPLFARMSNHGSTHQLCSAHTV